MPLSDKTMKHAIIACGVLAAAMVIVAGSMFWHDKSEETARANPDPQNSAIGAGSEPDETETMDSEDSFAFDAADPFAGNGSPSSTVHNVVVRATSDGPIGRFGYRLRSAESKLVTSSRKSWSAEFDVRGPRPVAQIAVQVSSGATYARCTIFVDGKQSSSYVARGVNHVVVCTA